MSQVVVRTERGWAGHFIDANRCRFRRNTLLEYGETRIVVSTVGLMDEFLQEGLFMEIGHNRYFETMAFHAKWVDYRYWDADVTREVSFESPWAIADMDAEDRANNMHEAVVTELMRRLEAGDTFQNTEGTDS